MTESDFSCNVIRLDDPIRQVGAKRQTGKRRSNVRQQNSKNKKPRAAFWNHTLQKHKEKTRRDLVCRQREHLNLFPWPLVIVPHCLVLAVKSLPLTVAEKELQERKCLPLPGYFVSPTNKSIDVCKPIDQLDSLVCLPQPLIWCMWAILMIVSFLFSFSCPTRIKR